MNVSEMRRQAAILKARDKAAHFRRLIDMRARMGAGGRTVGDAIYSSRLRGRLRAVEEELARLETDQPTTSARGSFDADRSPARTPDPSSSPGNAEG